MEEKNGSVTPGLHTWRMTSSFSVLAKGMATLICISILYKFSIIYTKRVNANNISLNIFENNFFR